jgi:hypothetical protein
VKRLQVSTDQLELKFILDKKTGNLGFYFSDKKSKMKR